MSLDDGDNLQRSVFGQTCVIVYSTDVMIIGEAKRGDVRYCFRCVKKNN